ncbi:hypothetical protein BGZ94_003471, partial [Podila epigama]
RSLDKNSVDIQQKTPGPRGQLHLTGIMEVPSPYGTGLDILSGQSKCHWWQI